MGKFIRAISLVSSKQLCLFCAIVFLFAGSGLQAQSRRPDLILTIHNDTIAARITKVSVGFLHYRSFAGDSTIFYTVSKARVAKVIYGNGEVEEVDNWDSNIFLYAKRTRKTKYQREIESWTTKKLLTEQAFYKNRFKPHKVIGLTAFAAAGGLQIFGVTQAWRSVFDGGSKPDGSVPIFTGIGIGAVIGMPLTFFGIRNGQKYRAVNNELRTRGIEGYN